MRVYISADYAENSGDREVVELLNKWGTDDYHKVDFVDTAKVSKGSVSDKPDCRMCDLKAEFNQQINVSSSVIIVIGDKTAERTAGSGCERSFKSQYQCMCTPYKQNVNGKVYCKYPYTCSTAGEDIGCINSYSYIRHEFEQAKKKNKNIIVVYNSLNKQESWLPSYMEAYKTEAEPFWIRNVYGERVGNYQFIKRKLGYE